MKFGSFTTKLMHLPLVISLLWAPAGPSFRREDPSLLVSCLSLHNSNTSECSIMHLSFSQEKHESVVKTVYLSNLRGIHQQSSVCIAQSNSINSQERKEGHYCERG